MITVDKDRNDDGQGGSESGAKKGFPIVLFILGIIVLLIAFAAIYPSSSLYKSPRSGGQFTQCQSNCKNIGTALEMYSTDNSGHYPPSISSLTPAYLRSIPTCASAGRDTYTASYKVFVARNKGETDAYTFFCSGNYHSFIGVAGDYPQYDSRNGLTVKH